VSYDAAFERQSMREHFTQMVRLSTGTHPYALDAAERIVKSDPQVHGGLVALVESEIGDALPAARKALNWFNGKGRG